MGRVRVFAALVADSFKEHVPLALLVSLATVALALDAVDGWTARRTRTSGSLGARFDAEADAFLILVLSVFVARSVAGLTARVARDRGHGAAERRWVATAVVYGVMTIVASLPGAAVLVVAWFRRTRPPGRNQSQLRKHPARA